MFIPNHKILQPDSTYITQANLNMHKPVMIMYFSPDCGHCQRLVTEMKPRLSQIKNVQIVMITFTRTEYPYMSLMRNFIRDYGLAKYPNIAMGTEYPTYKLQQFYKIKTTPYIAIYDHNGKLFKYYEKAPKMDELFDALKKA